MVWKWIKNIKRGKAEKARIAEEIDKFVKRVRINKTLPEYPISEGFLRSMSEAGLIEIVAGADTDKDAIKIAGENLAARNISEAGMRELAETLKENSQSRFPALVKDSSMAIINIFSASGKKTNKLAIETLISVLYGKQESIREAAGAVLESTTQGRTAIVLALE